MKVKVPAIVAVAALGITLGFLAFPGGGGPKVCHGHKCPPTATTATIPTTTTAPTTTSSNTYTVPGTIPSDCSVDTAPAILNWIATVPDNSTLQFGNGCYRVEETLELTNRYGLAFTGGTLKQLNPPQDQRPVWRLINSSGGFSNMRLTGSYTNGGVLDQNLQHAHGFDLRGSSFSINLVTVENVAGDCAYFGLGYDNTTRSSGSFSDSTCQSIGRNGVSVVAGDNITANRNTIATVGFDAFDIEPNVASGNQGSSTVAIDSNRISGVHLYDYSIIENAPITAQSFTNNTKTGLLRVYVGTAGPTLVRPTNVTVRTNTGTTGGQLEFDHVDGLHVSGNTGTVTTTDCTGITT